VQFCHFNTTGVLNKTEKRRKKKKDHQKKQQQKNSQNLGNLIQTVPQKGCSMLQNTVPDKPSGFCGR